MKRTVVGAVAMVSLLASAPSFAAKTNYKADIEGGSVGSAGTGVGNFTYDDVTKKLCGQATYTGLTGGPVTAAALKEGDGFTIVKPLAVSASPLVVEVTLSDEEAALLQSGPVYIAIGNATYGVAAGEETNGEVNGELVVDPTGAEQPCGGGGLTDGGAPPPPPDNPSVETPSDAGEAPPAASGLAPVDAAAPVGKKADDGGCSTSHSAPRSSLAGLALGLAAVALFGGRRLRRR